MQVFFIESETTVYARGNRQTRNKRAVAHFL